MAAAAAFPSSSSASSKSILGSTISLISKTGIRYEGLCYFLDLQDGRLGLTHVKILGTEGQMSDNAGIHPMNANYDTILFRGSEIKEMYIISTHDVHPNPEVAKTLADIESRLCSLLQGISSTSESLWSSEFWAPVTTPPVANFDGLGMPTYIPGMARSARYPGVIARPQHSTSSPGVIARPQSSSSPGVIARPQHSTSSPGVIARPQSSTNSPGVIARPQSSTRSPGEIARPQNSTRSPGVIARPQRSTRPPGVIAHPQRSTRSPGVIARPQRSQGLMQVSSAPSSTAQDTRICTAEGSFYPLKKSIIGQRPISAPKTLEPISDHRSPQSPYGEA